MDRLCIPVIILHLSIVAKNILLRRSHNYGVWNHWYKSISPVSSRIPSGPLLHHILSLIAWSFLENREFVFIFIAQFMTSANIRIHFGLQIVLVCLYSTPPHYRHCANLSEYIELIKCLSDNTCYGEEHTSIHTLHSNRGGGGGGFAGGAEASAYWSLVLLIMKNIAKLITQIHMPINIVLADTYCEHGYPITHQFTTH